MTDPMVCAAVYFDPAEAGPVRPDWLAEALRLLARTGLPVREFGLSEAPTDFKELLRPFGPDGRPLREALERGKALSVELYAHSTRTENFERRSGRLSGGRTGCPTAALGA